MFIITSQGPLLHSEVSDGPFQHPAGLTKGGIYMTFYSEQLIRSCTSRTLSLLLSGRMDPASSTTDRLTTGLSSGGHVLTYSGHKTSSTVSGSLSSLGRISASPLEHLSSTSGLIQTARSSSHGMKGAVKTNLFNPMQVSQGSQV